VQNGIGEFLYLQKSNRVIQQDYGTNCKDCELYKKLGDVCVVEHDKKFLWEYCRDFVPQVVLPDYRELMRSVKHDQALERQKLHEKKEREKKKKKKERLERIELNKKERRARLRRKREKEKKKLTKSHISTKVVETKTEKQLKADVETRENTVSSNTGKKAEKTRSLGFQPKKGKLDETRVKPIQAKKAFSKNLAGPKNKLGSSKIIDDISGVREGPTALGKASSE